MVETHEQVAALLENVQKVLSGEHCRPDMTPVSQTQILVTQARAQLKEAVAAAKLQGYIKALNNYAYWKGGVQYVGSCGTTLKEALKQAPVNCSRK